MTDECTDSDVCGSCGYIYSIDEVTEAECIHCHALRAMAEFAGCELRIDRDEDAPLLWAVWADGEPGDGDIAGAGDTPAQAIDDARKTIRGWNAARDEKNSDAWTAHNREPSR